MKYRVCVEWSVMAIIEVEAESIDEAIENIESNTDAPLPTNGGYIDGSFSVNHDFTIDENKEEG